jgi:hypothetical protein
MSSSVKQDPAYRRSLKEAIWILIAWAVCLVWTVGYAAVAGYNIDPDELRLMFGFPSWIFWGVGIPWLVATGFSIWFAMSVMEEEDLGADENPGEGGQ